MNILRSLVFVVIAITLVGCSEGGYGSRGLSVPLSMGQTVYVPVYSDVYHGDASEHFLLAASVSIHNTDTKNPIKVSSVRFYDRDGQLLNDYLDQPVTVAPLVTRTLILAKADQRGGGVGANLLVEWHSTEGVTYPIVEAVMAGTIGDKSLGFTSRGQVIAERSP